MLFPFQTPCSLLYVLQAILKVRFRLELLALIKVLSLYLHTQLSETTDETRESPAPASSINRRRVRAASVRRARRPPPLRLSPLVALELATRPPVARTPAAPT